MGAVMQRGKDEDERRHVMLRSDVEEWNRVLSEKRNDGVQVCRAHFSQIGIELFDKSAVQKLLFHLVSSKMGRKVARHCALIALHWCV